MLATIRLRLILLVLIVAVPLIAATLVVVERLADAQSQAQEQTLIASTRAIAAAVDAELKKHAAVGHALTTSVPLQSGDFAQFAKQAASAINQLPGAWVVVADVEGQQVVNTLRPFGEPLPMVEPLEIHRRAFETATYQVSDIVPGPVARRPVLGVFVPVFKDGKPALDVIVALDPHIFTRILMDQKLPGGWVTAVGDRKGHFIARSIDNDRFLGESISDGWRAAARQGKSEGVFDNISKEGVPLHSAFTNLAGSGWTVSVGASREVLNQPIRNSLWLLALSSIVLIFLIVGLAWWAARSIIGSMKSLEDASSSLLRNESVNVSRTGLREVDHALAGFESAANSILERETRHTLLVTELNHRVKNLFAIMGGIVSLSAKSAATPQELTKAIRGRLDALARAHELVLPKPLRSKAVMRHTTTLDALLRAILKPYVEENDLDRRIACSGPAVEIGDKTATSLALVIHELSTNAAKYGALANDAGRVDVSWVLDGGQLRLTWRERGGPVVDAAPSREGFGSMLVERSVKGQLHGELTRDWRPDGLEITLLLPQGQLLGGNNDA